MKTYTIRDLNGEALENALDYIASRTGDGRENIESLMRAAEDYEVTFDAYGDPTDEFSDELLQNGLKALITGEASDDEIAWENLRVRTFEEDGVMTYDKGLTITLPDGTEYQLTIVRSR